MGGRGGSTGGSGAGGAASAASTAGPLTADNVADALRDVIPELLNGPETKSGAKAYGGGSSQEGTRFGENKVFIHAAYEAVKQTRPNLTRAEFDNVLRAANKADKITLSRADLTSAMHKNDVVRSATATTAGGDKSGTDAFHFIRADRNGLKR